MRDKKTVQSQLSKQEIRIIEQLLQQPRSIVLERCPELALQSGEIADALSAELA